MCQKYFFHRNSALINKFATQLSITPKIGNGLSDLDSFATRTSIFVLISRIILFTKLKINLIVWTGKAKKSTALHA